MTIWTTSLLIGAVVCALLNYNSKRVLAWLLIGATNFTLTYIYFYHAIWWLPHPFVTGVADAVLVILLSVYGEHRWERWVRYAFMLSVLVSMSRLAGWIPTQADYGTALEVCNWLALIVMAGTGIVRLADERLDHGLVGSPARSRAGRAVFVSRAFLDKPRQSKGFLARAIR